MSGGAIQAIVALKRRSENPARGIEYRIKAGEEGTFIFSDSSAPDIGPVSQRFKAKGASQ